MLGMILSNAVIIPSIMTQEDVAVLAVPHRLVSLLLVMVAVVAASTILCSSDGIVCLAKAMCCRGVARTTWSLDWHSCQSAPLLGLPGILSRIYMAGQ